MANEGHATAVSDLERAEHLGYADSKGVKRVSVFNDGVQVNAATEETLQKIAGENYDSVTVNTSNPASIVITKKLGSTVVDTKTINIT